MNNSVRDVLSAINRVAKLIEDSILVLLLTGMIVLAALQIFQRNLLGSGFVWTDELLRMMVLGIALMGALAASRDDNHINIDIFTRFLSPRPKLVVNILVDAFTAAVCGLVAWYAIAFVRIEKEFGATILGDFPAWIFQMIIPVCFGLIAGRYIFYFSSKIYLLGKGKFPR